MADPLYEVKRYPFDDFRSDNSFFYKIPVIINMIALKKSLPDVHHLITTWEAENEPVEEGCSRIHVIDTPGVPFALQSIMQIYEFSEDEEYTMAYIGLGFKLRNHLVRADYRDEHLPLWWKEAIDFAQTKCVPEITQVILLYSDVLMFYDSLITDGVIRFEKVDVLQRREFFSNALSLLLKRHNRFQSNTPVFSTEAKMSVVTDGAGNKIRKCENCLKTEKNIKLLKCGKCKITHYCGPACQGEHWDKHKPFCKAMREEMKADLAPVPKKVSVPPERMCEFMMIEGPDGVIIMDQLKDLFAHTCFHCFKWLEIPHEMWNEEHGFCSPECRREYIPPPSVAASTSPSGC